VCGYFQTTARSGSSKYLGFASTSLRVASMGRSFEGLMVLIARNHRMHK